MNNEGNWYRQVIAIALAAASKAAVEYITNPGSREEAANQVRDAMRSIDYDAVARALTRYIDQTAEQSKDRLSDAIDTIRDRGVDAVDDAKVRAEKQVGKRKSRKGRFLFGLILGAVVGYLLLDEQRRDEILDKLTGASGPIEQTVQNAAGPVTSTAQQAVQSAASSAGPSPASTGSTGSSTPSGSSGSTGTGGSAAPGSAAGTSGSTSGSSKPSGSSSTAGKPEDTTTGTGGTKA